MDKYQVLLTLIVYFIVVALTSFIFSYSATLAVSSPNPSTITTDTAWDVAKFIIGGLWLSIPGLPTIVTVIVELPFLALLIYFLYLNLPSVKFLGSGVDTKQP